jgi:8-oxo-dGTP diphosphatase
LIVESGSLLLVHHRLPNGHDFWVAPGGGVIGAEELPSAAIREAAEETGLIVEAGSLAYVEELISGDLRQCKFWYLAKVVGGTLSVPSHASEENIIDVRFLAPDELRGKIVYPAILCDEFWAHLRVGFVKPRYLGVQEMASA